MSSTLTQLPVPVAAPAGQPRGGRFYHPELDVLRFFAFFSVFLSHLEFNMGHPAWVAHRWLAELWLGVHGAGFSGVALFFTLSSYLITELLLRERERTGTVHLRDFYVRRVLRIWPLYFFFLLVVRPFAAHHLPLEQFSRGDLAAFLLLAGNWACYLHGWPLSVAAPLWSISVEEQFYLGWPWLLRNARRQLPRMAVAMLVVANASRIVMALRPAIDPSMWVNTLSRLDPFAVGALLAWWLHGRRLSLGWFDRLLIGGLGVLLLLELGRFGEHMGPRGLYFYPVEALACGLLLLAVLLPSGGWRPGVAGGTFTYLGRISYGLYVYHLLFLTLMERHHAWGVLRQSGFALVLTIAASALSYALLERPFLLLKTRFTYVRSRI